MGYHAKDFLPHLRRLSEEIGPRPSGSYGNQEAAAHIANWMRVCGLAVEMQTFPCTAWETGETVLIMYGERVEAYANPFSVSCDVTAPIVTASTLAELEAADITGKIAVLYGALARQPLQARAWMFKSEQDTRVVDLLETGEPEAVIMINSGPYELPRLIEDASIRLPSATVPVRVGKGLLEQPGQTVQLKIEGCPAPGRTSNIVGRLPGKRPERISLMAHYDTKIDTPGAFDNASGVSVLMALMNGITHQEWEYELEFIAFTNEEYLPLGDDEYVRRAGSFDKVAAAINFDGLGSLQGATSLALTGGSPNLLDLLTRLSKPYLDITWVDPWPESNHSTFAFRSVPSLAFSSTGGPQYSHSHSDTLDWLNPDKLVSVAELTSEVVKALQERPPHWGRNSAQ